MFADSITITIDGDAKVLNKINQDSYGSEYFLREAEQELRMKIRHSSYTANQRATLVDRHNVELVQTVYPVAPAVVNKVRKTYAVIENDRNDGITDPLNFNLGFFAFFTSGNITKLLNYES